MAKTCQFTPLLELTSCGNRPVRRAIRLRARRIQARYGEMSRRSPRCGRSRTPVAVLATHVSFDTAETSFDEAPTPSECPPSQNGKVSLPGGRCAHAVGRYVDVFCVPTVSHGIPVPYPSFRRYQQTRSRACNDGEFSIERRADLDCLTSVYRPRLSARAARTRSLFRSRRSV